jgi:putative ABC transport system permease protein
MNNFLVSIRHLMGNRTNTLINLAGLTLGLGIVTVVLVFVLNELGYNRSFFKHDRIYRIINQNSADNNLWANTPFVAGETSAEKFAEVEAYAHQYNIQNIEVKRGDEFISNRDILCTESSFFQMFGIKILNGSLFEFDRVKGKILVSKNTAEKYFGNENPVGKLLTLRYTGKEYIQEVAAVYEDFPQNSTIKASLIAGNDFGLEHLYQSIVSTGAKPSVQELKESWNGTFFINYLLLKKGTSVSGFEAKLHQLGVDQSDKDNRLNLSLQALTDIYFGSEKIVDNNRGDKGNRSMLFILASVGFLILVVACINYLNLTSAQALTQTKALAVRKVCGAPRNSLIRQMVFESVLISLIALPFALLLGHFSFPFISHLLGKSYQLSLASQFLPSIIILILITISTGALSGLLVAVKITSFRLVETLKGQRTHEGVKHNWRKTLVVFQMAVFIVLVAVMALVQKQVHYGFNKDLGIAKEGLIRIPLGDHNYELFKQEIRKNPNVLQVSGALWLPPNTRKMTITIPKVDNPKEKVTVKGLFVDYMFAGTMGMKVIMGSDFDESKNNSGVLINESAIKALGLKEILGEKTAFGQIVGVVNDFNMYSIHEAIGPMIIGLNPQMCREIAVKINSENTLGTIDFLKKTWKTTGGIVPFDFDFTNDILNQIYESDIRFSKTIGLLAVIAIIIASLGLFGLSLLINQQKTKEIGIRKVSGARVSEIILLINSDFVIWVSIAFVVATPIAWFAMSKWLESFAYKTELSWWIFALAGLLALGIALLTVSFQSYKAATKNPVESLRYE